MTKPSHKELMKGRANEIQKPITNESNA